LPLIHIRTAGAAGKLSFFANSHLVPGVDGVLRTLVGQWAEKNKVEVQADIIDGKAWALLRVEEAQAKAGHDFWPSNPWDAHAYAGLLASAFRCGGGIASSLLARSQQ
jgi:hypothetical protein